MSLFLSDEAVSYRFREPFRISRGVMTAAETLRITLERDGIIGRGEAAGVSYQGETIEGLRAQIAGIEVAGLTRQSLQTLLPGGGARNALDCAFWDLEAKAQGVDVASLAGLGPLRPLRTTITLGMDTPERMAEKAAGFPAGAFIKIKLGGTEDLDRVAAVRTAAPTAVLSVDANQGWTLTQLTILAPSLAALGVTMIEQPVPVADDAALADYRGPIPLCADEACRDRSSLDGIVGKYQIINIKLDKTGGLTEALALAADAKARGLRLMVGCMAGTSLAMAPAFLVGQLCELVDLDAPLFLETDVPHGMRYAGGFLNPFDRQLWG